MNNLEEAMANLYVFCKQADCKEPLVILEFKDAREKAIFIEHVKQTYSTVMHYTDSSNINDDRLKVYGITLKMRIVQ